MEKFSPRNKKELWLVVSRWAQAVVARLKFCYRARFAIGLEPWNKIFFWPGVCR